LAGNSMQILLIDGRGIVAASCRRASKYMYMSARSSASPVLHQIASRSGWSLLSNHVSVAHTGPRGLSPRGSRGTTTA
jgi:hypothetical protein